MSENLYLAWLPPERAERKMPELKPPLSPAQALVEAQRCLYCYDAPCINACPTRIDIPQFIRQIATGDLKGSARTILEANILGMSCARVCPVEVLCEGACVYEVWHKPPIQIGRLQRYATDWAYERNLQFFQPGPPTGFRVALIGAGPASLACAHELRRLGHEAVLYEGRNLPGGLNTTGVAPYKLYAEESLREVAYIQQIGFEIRTGVWVGRDVTFQELEEQYDALFLGVGLGEDSWLQIPGARLSGVRGAIEFIEEMKNAPNFCLEGVRDAVVVGGGNTAVDVARELRKLGIPRVTLVYRRSEREAPAYRHERDWAAREGVFFRYQAQPVEILGTDHVEAVRCVETELGQPDETGRRSPRPVPGSDFTIPADLVVMAIGQHKLEALLGSIEGLRLEHGRVVVDPQTGQCTAPRYFAGGDCVNGGKEVVHAVAEGKRAAHGIHRYLMQRTGKPSATQA